MDSAGPCAACETELSGKMWTHASSQLHLCVLPTELSNVSRIVLKTRSGKNSAVRTLCYLRRSNMDLHRRNTRSKGSAESLKQPLLSGDEHILSSSGREADAGSSSAVVPYSINRVDWGALLTAVASACKAGWNGVLATISSCLGTFFSGARQSPQLRIEQEVKLQSLQERIQEPYDVSNPAHQEALQQLWRLAFPGEPWVAVKHSKWTEMGWQRDDPGSDFRGAGFIALQNLLYLAENRPDLFQRLLHKTDGRRSEWEYPFAVAGVNLTFMLAEVVDLRKQHTGAVGHVPSTPAGRTFLELLDSCGDTFEEIYCTSFEVLDRVWLEMRASYMDFSAVMQRVRSQAYSALSSRPRSLEGFRALMTP